MTTGTKISNLRVAKRWSQTEVGFFVGVSQTSIANWEKGKSLKHSYLKKLAEVLDVTVDYLVDESQQKSQKVKKKKEKKNSFKIIIKAPNYLLDDVKKKISNF